MKQLNSTQIYDMVKRACGETPFREINFGDLVTIKQYWTLISGVMGFQMHTIAHDYRGESITVTHGKTRGHGYCKESESYDSALRAMGIRAKGDLCKGSSGISHRFHIGGNYYFVPKSQIRKYK